MNWVTYFLIETFKLSAFTVGALAVALIKDNHKKGRSNSRKLK